MNRNENVLHTDKNLVITPIINCARERPLLYEVPKMMKI